MSTNSSSQGGSPAPGLPGVPEHRGDEAAAGTPGTGEDVCPGCGGSGRLEGRSCPDCGGTGKVTRAIGGG